MNYMKFWFWIDLMSSFPYDDTIAAFQSENANAADLQRNAQLLKFIRFLKFIKVVRLLRALKLKKLFGRIMEYISVSQSFTSFLSFLKLCLLILCIAHWLGCIWYMVAKLEDVRNLLYNKKSHKELVVRIWYN